MSKNKFEQEVCAPGRLFEDGSCMSLEVLVEMAKAHNKEMEEKGNKNKLIKLDDNYITIEPGKYKRYLVDKFKKLYTNCKNESCWLTQPFMKKMEKLKASEIKQQSFRPAGPQGSFEWLNTHNINEVMKQYEQINPDFIFLGAVPLDFDDLDYLGIKNLDFKDLMENKKKTKIGIIFNLDKSWQPGSHWTASYADLKKGIITYSDSVAHPPEREIRRYMKRIYKFCKNVLGNKSTIAIYNKYRAQYGNSECGVYSIANILRLLKGEDFTKICKDKTPDKEINKCRDIYFNKK